MPSFCIGLARRPTNVWQKSRREQANQRLSQPQNQPNEERMRSTHPRKRQRLVVLHGTTAKIRPHHASRNFAVITKFLTRKLKISRILSVSWNFCASKIRSYTVHVYDHEITAGHCLPRCPQTFKMFTSCNTSYPILSVPWSPRPPFSSEVGGQEGEVDSSDIAAYVHSNATVELNGQL